jgi:hypothetical protein
MGRSAVPRAARHASHSGAAALATIKIKSNGAPWRRTAISRAENRRPANSPIVPEETRLRGEEVRLDA